MQQSLRPFIPLAFSRAMVAFSRQCEDSFFNTAWREKQAGRLPCGLVKVIFRLVACGRVSFKYMHTVGGMSHALLWYTLAFLK